MGSRFFEGPHIPKKGFQKAPGRPKPKSDQFCVSATHKHIGKALFSRALNPEKRPPKGSWLPQAKKVARVISNSHNGKLLLWRAPIPAKRLPKGPWLPRAKKCPVLSANHILGSRILKGPNSRKKGLQKAPGRRLQPSARQACSIHAPPLWASLGLSGPLWASASQPASPPASQPASQPAREAQRGSERLRVVQRSPERPREAQTREAQRGPCMYVLQWLNDSRGRLNDSMKQCNKMK